MFSFSRFAYILIYIWLYIRTFFVSLCFHVHVNIQKEIDKMVPIPNVLLHKFVYFSHNPQIHPSCIRTQQLKAQWRKILLISENFGSLVFYTRRWGLGVAYILTILQNSNDNSSHCCQFMRATGIQLES